MPLKTNPHLRKSILDVVSRQISGNDPPQTAATYQRLVDEGLSDREARELIACVVSCEMFRVCRDDKEFDLERFSRGLDALPVLPWDVPDGPYDD